MKPWPLPIPVIGQTPRALLNSVKQQQQKVKEEKKKTCSFKPSQLALRLPSLLFYSFPVFEYKLLLVRCYASLDAVGHMATSSPLGLQQVINQSVCLDWFLSKFTVHGNSLLCSKLLVGATGVNRTVSFCKKSCSSHPHLIYQQLKPYFQTCFSQKIDCHYLWTVQK